MPDKTPRLPKALRRLLWLGLFLLTLAALFSGLRLWLDAKGRAVLAAHAARHPAPAKPAMSPGSARPGSVPAEKVALFAQLYSRDSTEREAFLALLNDLTLTCNRTGLYPDTRIDFLKALKWLKLPIPDGMTQQQAAAALLKHLEKFGPLLDELRAACAGGPWDFCTPASKETLNGVPITRYCDQLLFRSESLLSIKAKAHWMTGDAAAARGDWQDLVAVHRHVSDLENGNSSMVSYASLALTATAKAGLAIGGWRDEDLPSVARDLGAVDALEWHRLLIEEERKEAAALMETFLHDREALKKKFQRPSLWSGTSPTPWKDTAENIGLSVTSDTQVAANAALIDLSFQEQIDRFNYRDRLYIPPSAPAAGSLEDVPSETRDPLSQAYFFLADNLPSGRNFDEYTEDALEQQSEQDQTRLALALEAHRRSTGTYPDSLDAVAPFFPGGPPHDVATGQPYFYEKKPDGTFRLWGAGIDQKNDGGAEKRDVLWHPNQRL